MAEIYDQDCPLSDRGYQLWLDAEARRAINNVMAAIALRLSREDEFRAYLRQTGRA